MEKIIHKFFNIDDKIQKDDFPFINLSFRNKLKNQISINLKDYCAEKNFHHINMESLKPKFFINDTIEIKCSYEDNIKIYCIDPFFDREIDNGKWCNIGCTNTRDNNNYFLLKTKLHNINHIILVTFKTIDKKKYIINQNIPINIKMYVKNNEIMEEFVSNFKSNFSNIFNIPEKKIIKIHIEKKLLILCDFILLPLEKGNNYDICEKILDLSIISKSYNKYKDDIININGEYETIISNIVHIDSINYYSKNFLQGIHITSEDFDIYRNKVNMEYSEKKNIIKINNDNCKMKIFIQKNDKDTITEFNSNLNNIIFDDNIFIINTNIPFYLEITIKKKIDNLLMYNNFNNIEINELSKFKLVFNLKQKNEIFKNFLLNNKEITKFKIIVFFAVFGILSGCIYSNIKNKEIEDEIIYYDNTDKKFNNIDIEKSINDIKYEKYNLDAGFFEKKQQNCNKNMRIINNLKKLKDIVIHKKNI